MSNEAIYVGIDVSKAQLDIAVRPTQDQWSCPSSNASIARVTKRLSKVNQPDEHYEVKTNGAYR